MNNITWNGKNKMLFDKINGVGYGYQMWMKMSCSGNITNSAANEISTCVEILVALDIM